MFIALKGQGAVQATYNMQRAVDLFLTEMGEEVKVVTNIPEQGPYDLVVDVSTLSNNWLAYVRLAMHCLTELGIEIAYPYYEGEEDDIE